MRTQRYPRLTRPMLYERAADYERQNPQFAETLRRYAVVMQTYENAVASLTTPSISVSNSTVRLEQPRIW